MSQIATPPMPSSAPPHIPGQPDMSVIQPLMAPPVPSPSLTPSSMVMVNGRQITVAEAARLAEQGERDRTEYARLKELSEASRLAFGPNNTDPVVARANHRKVLMANGWKADDADEYLSRQYSQPVAPNGQEQVRPDANPSQPQPGSQEFNLLRDSTLQMIIQNMRTSVDTELNSNPDFIAYAQHVTERDGDDAGKNWMTAYKNEAYTSIRAAGSRKLDESGGNVKVLFGEGLSSLAKAVAAEVVGKARFNLGDPKRLGKSALTVGGEDQFGSFQSKPPVPPAKYKAGMHQSELDKAQTDRMTDALVRSVAAGLSPQNL